MKVIFSIMPIISLIGCQTIGVNDNGAKNLASKSDEGVEQAFATAVLEPKSGSKAHGTAWFKKIKDGLQIIVAINNVEPGLHGIHIHEKGDCSAADASSAGEHFNPAHLSHGSPNPLMFHAGDLGNINIDTNGHGTLNLVIPTTNFHPDFLDWSGIIGKSLVLHSKADDLVSQPSGDSGSRIACGVIQP